MQKYKRLLWTVIIAAGAIFAYLLSIYIIYYTRYGHGLGEHLLLIYRIFAIAGLLAALFRKYAFCISVYVGTAIALAVDCAISATTSVEMGIVAGVCHIGIIFLAFLVGFAAQIFLATGKV